MECGLCRFKVLRNKSKSGDRVKLCMTCTKPFIFVPSLLHLFTAACRARVDQTQVLDRWAHSDRWRMRGGGGAVQRRAHRLASSSL
jgi:hypothetical protein